MLTMHESAISEIGICGQIVRASSSGSKGPEFDHSVRPLVVKIDNHC